MALIIELFLIGVGLAMDAFAVSVCKGLSMKKVKARHAAVIALFFGGFQALMPVVGWALGIGFEKYITAFDHWIAFILLLIIGGKMVMDVIRGEQDPEDDRNLPFKLDIKELFLLAIATSIDALAVGVTFAFLNYNILLAAHNRRCHLCYRLCGRLYRQRFRKPLGKGRNACGRYNPYPNRHENPFILITV